jgi:hypothetical protein
MDQYIPDLTIEQIDEILNDEIRDVTEVRI